MRLLNGPQPSTRNILGEVQLSVFYRSPTVSWNGRFILTPLRNERKNIKTTGTNQGTYYRAASKKNICYAKDAKAVQVTLRSLSGSAHKPSASIAFLTLLWFSVALFNNNQAYLVWISLFRFLYIFALGHIRKIIACELFYFIYSS